MAHHLSPRSVVPRLRKDLNVGAPPTGTGAEVIQVGPADADDRILLHGFELSIARMLDGRRTLKDVVQNCEQLGLPVHTRALEGFVRQLKCYGLLGEDHDAPQRRRSEWSSEVRELFRSALRHARTGRMKHARMDLIRLLLVAPGTPEAQRMMEWLDTQGPAGAPQPEFQEVLRDAQRSWSEELRPPALAAFERAVRRSPRPLLGLLGAAALLAAGASVPLPHVVTASVVLGPIAQARVLAPRAGVIGEVRVHEADVVEKGAVLFTWNTDDVETLLSEAQERLQATREPLYRALPRTRGNEEALARHDAAEQALARARSALMAEQRDAAGGAPGEELTFAEQQFEQAYAELEAAQAALDALTPSSSSLAALVNEIAALRQQARDRVVTAPAAGTVTHVLAREGQPVSADDTIAQLDDLTRLRAVVTLTPRQAATVRVGEPLTLHLAGASLVTAVESVSDYEIAAVVENAGGAMKTGSATADLELKPRSIVERLRD